MRGRDALGPSEGLLRGLLAAAPDALLAVDDGGTIVFVNNQVEHLFGWAQDELVAQSVDVLVPEGFAVGHPGLRAGYAAHPTTRPMGAGLQLWARRRDGSEFPAEVSLSAMQDETGATLVLAAVRDVTDRRELEAARQQQALDAQREQSHRLESLGQLAGGVAHDFNNLLGVIINYDTLLARRITDPVARADLDEIRFAAERGAALTRQLLTFARRDIANPRPVELTATVRSVASMLERTLGEHVELRLELDDEPVATLADSHQLEQILVNLALNARDAMAGGGVLTIAAYTAGGTGSDEGRAAVLQVRDTGEGMAPETLQRAFEPFFSTKSRGRGTGLGLATVYGIVQQSGGEVTLESSLGEGTVATVRLPALDPSRARLASEPDAIREFAGGMERVLLVEDETPLRIGTSRLLEAHGYAVAVACDGVEALRVIEDSPEGFHVVLTDVAMPRMRGDELATELAGRNPELPVIFMSGYDSGESPVTGRLLAKPVSESDLLQSLREVLDG